jgi:hypothetical protein
MSQDERSKAQQITEHLNQFPTDSYTEVAELLGVSVGYVSSLAKRATSCLNMPNPRHKLLRHWNKPSVESQNLNGSKQN